MSQTLQLVSEHAAKLSSQQWNQICNRLDGTLQMKNSWSLLRHMLDPCSSQCESNKRITKLLFEVEKQGQDVETALKAMYFPGPRRESLPTYNGAPNADLGAPIAEAEVWAALSELRTTSAPGLDRITNKTLRNLDSKSVAALTDYMNEQWEQGTLPQEWNSAKVTFIPKHNKPLDPNNLRSISLTSCTGKLMEHVILNRLNRYMEQEKLFSSTMYGFRAGLSTQDVKLQLKEDVLNPTFSHITRAILALDLTKAFDNVSHSSILQSLSELNVGSRTHRYVSAFLSNRSVCLQLGTFKIDPFTLGSKGTPQGLVLSPFLFNVTLIPLARELAKLSSMNHSLYADDITIWVNTGNHGNIESKLQLAADIVVKHANNIGLTSSAAKSELLVIDFKKQDTCHIQVTLDDTPIRRVNKINILGLNISDNGLNADTIKLIRTSVQNTASLIKRISNRHGGMREADTRRLIQAFCLCRITYSIPYLYFLLTEIEQLNRLIRNAYKTALHLPNALHLPKSTATDKLLQLGVHNTLGELAEVDLFSQYQTITHRNRTAPPAPTWNQRSWSHYGHARSSRHC